MQPLTVQSAPTASAWGTWECGSARGTIRVGDYGYVGESAAVLAGDSAVATATPEEAARAAYRREVVLAPVLADILARFRIEHPAAEAAAYAVTGNDPRAAVDGEPGEDARYVNLAPWEREMVRTARANARMAVMVMVRENGREAVTQAAVAGQYVVMARFEDGAETGRWRVLDGSRKVALFLAR